MAEKEDTARTIFGVGRSDGYRELILLTPLQFEAILDTLAFTDQVDEVYDQKGGGRLYAATFKKAREKYESINGVLPTNDLRSNLLGATLKAYQDAGTLILGSETKHFKGDSTPTIATARMRKAFLRKIMAGDLDPDGQAFLNYLLARD